MRRRVVLATLLVSLARGSARADWQVHRDDARALTDRAERALREQPDDDEIARRLIRLAGKGGRAALLGRFRDRAEADASYATASAYARLLLAAGDARGAAAAFERALAMSPHALPALTGRARALAASGADSEALRAYDEALSLERRSGPRRRLLEAELALLALRTGRSPGSPPAADLDRIVALRRELVGLDPDRDGAAERLADALEQAGRPGEAAAALEARIGSGRGADKLALALRAVRLRIAGGDTTRVVATATGLARQLPASDTERRREVWSVALLAARRAGTLHELADELARLGEAAGAAEWDALGQARDELGDLEGALAAERTAAQRAPRDPEIAGRLVALLDRLGRDDEATRACEELAHRNPSNARFAIEVVDRAMRRGQRERAAAAFDGALGRFGRDRSALLELAAVAARFGLDDHAHAAWQRLRRLDPGNEVAIVGLGEAEFQRGHKDEARRTWAALRDRPRPSAASRLRYAEVLLEHDFVVDAVAEARKAQALDPKSAASHRLLAQIFEREKKLDDAVTEWNVVLGLARAPGGRGADDQASLRREARTRLLGLYTRFGRGRLDNQIRKLAEEVREHPEDTEAVLFLAEAQERAGDATGAATTLRGLLARAPEAGDNGTDASRPAKSGPATGGATEPSVSPDVVVDATFGLVHLLKRNGQLDEAITRLEDVARAAPNRAREAHLQIAEIALARYDSARALDQAARAAAGADGPTLARVGDVQLRAGDDRAATDTYRAAVAADGGPAAAMALVRLLERSGDRKGAADVLDRLLRTSGDDDLVTEASRLALDLGEVQDGLPELERRLAERLAARDTPAGRAALVAALKRFVPALYRDAHADEARARLGRQALRPLLELVTDAEQPPDRTTVELIGMLGRGDAAPALVRLVQAPSSARLPPPMDGLLPSSTTSRDLPRRPEPAVGADTRLAAVIALGRLGDRRGAPALERLAATADTNLRAAAVWALGRVGEERALPLLLAALQDRRPEVAMAACLGLGRRAGGPQAWNALLATATDARQPIPVRRTAILALGRIPRADSRSALFRLLDSGDADLATAAALALVGSPDASVAPALLTRALLPRRFGLADTAAPLVGLNALATGGAPADEARVLGSPRLDLDTATSALLRAEAHPTILPLVRTNAAALRDALAEALAGGGEPRREALSVLDGPGDDLALGSLTAGDEASGGPEVAAVLHEIVPPLADRIALFLEDPDPTIRAPALRVLAKLGDERVTPARIAAAVVDDSPLLAAAGVYGAGVLARDRPATFAAAVTALAPALSDPSWPHRLAAVRALSAFGPASVATLERARNDTNPIIRGAVLDAIARHAIDLPSPPSTMP